MLTTLKRVAVALALLSPSLAHAEPPPPGRYILHVAAVGCPERDAALAVLDLFVDGAPLPSIGAFMRGHGCINGRGLTRVVVHEAIDAGIQTIGGSVEHVWLVDMTFPVGRFWVLWEEALATSSGFAV